MSKCWIDNTEQELAMLYYFMTDSDKQRKIVEPQYRPLYEESYKIYKRALWQSLSANKLSITQVRTK